MAPYTEADWRNLQTELLVRAEEAQDAVEGRQLRRADRFMSAALVFVSLVAGIVSVFSAFDVFSRVREALDPSNVDLYFVVASVLVASVSLLLTTTFARRRALARVEEQHELLRLAAEGLTDSSSRADDPEVVRERVIARRRRLEKELAILQSRYGDLEASDLPGTVSATQVDETRSSGRARRARNARDRK